MRGEQWEEYETAVLVILRSLGWEYERIRHTWSAFFTNRTESSLRGKIASFRETTSLYDPLARTWRPDEIHAWIDELDISQTQKDYCHQLL